MVTRRCTQRQFLLRRDEATNNASLYCLAEAAKRFDIDVILPCAMSNHLHNVVYAGDKAHDTKYACDRDDAGRRTKCQGLTGETTYLYKGGAFVGTVTKSDGAASSKTSVGRDKSDADRIVVTAWDDSRGLTSTKYTYNADGTMATSVSTDPRMTVTQTFTYDGGWGRFTRIFRVGASRRPM